MKLAGGGFLSRPRKALTRGVLAAGALFLLFVGVAYAGSTVYHEGWLGGNGVRSGWEGRLFETSARSLSGDTVCTAAWSGSSQVGQVACSNDLASHAYDGVTWREAFCRATISNSVVARCRGDYN
jgi:hypothetical protein